MQQCSWRHPDFGLDLLKRNLNVTKACEDSLGTHLWDAIFKKHYYI